MMITQNLTPRPEISEQNADWGLSTIAFEGTLAFAETQTPNAGLREKRAREVVRRGEANIRLSGNPTRP